MADTDNRKDARPFQRSDVEVLMPRPLSEKVSVVGGIKTNDALQRAEEALARIADEFDGLLAEELAALDELMADYMVSKSSETLDKLFRRIHNLRGQGTTLGYPLVTRIGSSFCGYLIERNPDRPLRPDLVEQHLKALHIVMKEGKNADADSTAHAVAEALEQAVQREKL